MWANCCRCTPKLADKFNIVRSVAHKFADHGGGHKRFMTARDPKEPTGFVNDHPAVPSMIAKVFENRRRLLPNYVEGVDAGRQDIDTFSFGSAYLDSSTASVHGVRATRRRPKFKVENLALLPGLETRIGPRSSCSSNSTPGAARSISRACSIRWINSTARPSTS